MADASEQVRGLFLSSLFPFVNQANQRLMVLMVVLSASNALLTLQRLHYRGVRTKTMQEDALVKLALH